MLALANHLVTEDDTPVDNLFSETQQRLLTEPLYSSWAGPPSQSTTPEQPRPFLVAANVGLFATMRQPPLVPDVFLSLDVQVAEDWYAKRHRSYFFWEFGKPPDVVIEIVSNREGHELGSKLSAYARMGVTYYAVYDPLQELSETVLQLFEKQGTSYQPYTGPQLQGLGLGLILWEGTYEGKSATWVRWCDAQGEVIPTGAERAARETARATQEAAARQREAAARRRAEAELAELRAELARLRPGTPPGETLA